MTTEIKKPRVDDQRIEEIRTLAESAFKYHELTLEFGVGLFRHWRCAEPGTVVYAFNITTFPGRIVVTGDIGDLIVERVRDMIPWCRGSIDSISYFAEKVPHSIVKRVYDPDSACEWVEDELGRLDESDEYHEPGSKWAEQNKKYREELRAALDHVDDEHEFIERCRDLSYPDWWDGFCVNTWNSNFLWCREAIKKFLQLLDAGQGQANLEVPA